MGALVQGDPLKERIIISHEKLFMPEYPPYEVPPLHKAMPRIRQLTMNGRGDVAGKLAVELGKEVGISDMIWTNPHIPACQLEIEMEGSSSVANYARAVNYETGEALAAWESGGQKYNRSVFISRPDQIGVVKMSTDSGVMNLRMRLNQLPIEGGDAEEWNVDELIEMAASDAVDDMLVFTTKFKKRWPGSLKGYYVEAKVKLEGGSLRTDGAWMIIQGTREVYVIIDIILDYALPLDKFTRVDKFINRSYDGLLERHAEVQSEMFNRFGLQIGTTKTWNTAEELFAASSEKDLNPELVNQVCEAARYILISSTGEIPPTLQGIWGGTWRPAWSGDFTLNGNVPSAIACGLNGNFKEVTEAYINMMWGFFDDFKTNARGLYDAPGIFVPSRCSDLGYCYHYNAYYAHLYWLAGSAWTAQFFYDYWQYTQDEKFLKDRAIPFMLAAAEFYEEILMEGEDGKLMFIPSYSPEVGPLEMHPVAINATMDVAAVKQLLRNLLKLKQEGLLKTRKDKKWTEILGALPAYTFDDSGDLNEWIWPGMKNDNQHRHASHLYPLFYEVDPDFESDPALIQAAITAIEKRMEYRRAKNGAEMAFGLVQKGLAAAHIGDVAHAYECVSWLCRSYWSPAFTAYHDPGEIFNADISGGLPAVVIDMLVQSTTEDIFLLPALPEEWPEGKVKGVLARGGFVVDLEWKDLKPVKATIKSLTGNDARINIHEDVYELELAKGEIKTINF